MKLAFCLFKYFPYGGLQRDFLRIARTLRERGHTIDIYTMKWEGEKIPGLNVHLIKPKGWTNHARSSSFAKQVQVYLALERYDLVIGFNKMPHLDMYYAADVCYQSRIAQQRHAAYRLLPRYRQWLALEQSVFARGNQTEIMLISPLQQKEYTDSYQTEAARFHLLPPGIAKDRIAPSNAAEIRARVRDQYQLGADQKLLLTVGSGFKTKGLDRVIRALAALPPELKNQSHLFVIGHDEPGPFAKLAQRLQVADRISFMGGRSDVPDFLLAADLLLHPSYHENTGTALLEAIVAGLPVLTVDVCGYAHYVQTAQAGIVMPSPFSQTEFNLALQKMLLSSESEHWRQNGLAFAKSADIYSLPEKAADLIEQIGRKRAVYS